MRWAVSTRYSQWGTTDWSYATLYISPTVPAASMYEVVAHEWSHEPAVLDYRGDVGAATAATNKAFGGSGLVDAERAADCMSRLQGATWTHYTSCADARWRALARQLLEGEQTVSAVAEETVVAQPADARIREIVAKARKFAARTGHPLDNLDDDRILLGLRRLTAAVVADRERP